MKKLFNQLYGFKKNRDVLLFNSFNLITPLTLRCFFLSAQHLPHAPLKKEINIAVINGAEIHSTDKCFNHFVSRSKGITGKILVSAAKEGPVHKLPFNSPLSINRNEKVASALKGHKKKKTPNILRKFKIEPDHNDQQKFSLRAERIMFPFPITPFFLSRHYAPFYVVPDLTSHLFFNRYRIRAYSAIKQAPDDLYFPTINFYDRYLRRPSFLDHLFVRPPPVTG